MSRGPDAATLLEHALRTDAGRRGVTYSVSRARATRWASATFTGARHVLEIEGAWDTAATGWLAALPETELTLRRHLVADLTVAEVHYADGRFTATIETLTVEDR